MGGPDFGYNLNMSKSIYLMSPPDGFTLTEDQLESSVCQLESIGIPRSNIKIHPLCQDRCDFQKLEKLKYMTRNVPKVTRSLENYYLLHNRIEKQTLNSVIKHISREIKNNPMDQAVAVNNLMSEDRMSCAKYYT